MPRAALTRAADSVGSRSFWACRLMVCSASSVTLTGSPTTAYGSGRPATEVAATPLTTRSLASSTACTYREISRGEVLLKPSRKPSTSWSVGTVPLYSGVVPNAEHAAAAGAIGSDTKVAPTTVSTVAMPRLRNVMCRSCNLTWSTARGSDRFVICHDGVVSDPSPAPPKPGVGSWPVLPEPLAVPVPDSHCHLDIAYDVNKHGPGLSVDEALQLAGAVGVTRIVQVGYDVASSRFGVEVANTHAQVVAAVALHPNEAPRLAASGAFDAAFAEIGNLARDDRVVAIGETGLDHFRTGPDGLQAQEESFRRHIALAKELRQDAGHS